MAYPSFRQPCYDHVQAQAQMAPPYRCRGKIQIKWPCARCSAFSSKLAVVLFSTAFFIPGCGLVLCACACCFARRRSPASPSPDGLDGGAARQSTSRDAEAVQAGLWPARSAVARSDLVTLVCLVDILGNIILLFLLSPSGQKDSGFAPSGNLERDRLLSMMLETLSSAIFLLAFGRWEQQRHLVTLWQTLQSLRYFLIRRSLFASPWMFLGVAFLLPLVSVVGMVCELSVDHPLRLPPFLPKKWILMLQMDGSAAHKLPNPKQVHARLCHGSVHDCLQHQGGFCSCTFSHQDHNEIWSTLAIKTFHISFVLPS